MASRSADSIKMEWLKPHEAILHIRLDGEYPKDRLTGLRISLSGNDYFEIQECTDQLMTHPFEKEYAVVPEDEQIEVSVSATIGDKEYNTRTIVPHLLLDTRTQLNLSLSEERLHMVSSWIEEYAGELQMTPDAVDTVRVGYYLDDQGYITVDYQPSSVGMVVETDGRHGKAVALSDVRGEWVFSTSGLSSGLTFETIDGKVKEGLLNRRRSEVDTLGMLFYDGSLPYPSNCAFSQADGFDLCWNLNLIKGKEPSLGSDMQNVAKLMDGSYVPSVSEMAALYNSVYGFGKERLVGQGFQKPQGSYLTSSESSEQTVFSMDFTQGALTAYASKRFSPFRVRLFYIF